MTAVIPDGLKLAAVTAREESAGRFCIFGIWQSAGIAGRGGCGDIILSRLLSTAGSADKNASRECADKTPVFSEGNYDAVILAAAGLKRLGLQERIHVLYFYLNLPMVYLRGIWARLL